MVTPVGPSGGHISYSFSFKDTNGDGNVSFGEYMAPVPDDVTAITPADPSASPTMKEIFEAYDSNHDGLVSTAEMQRTLDVRPHDLGPVSPKELADAVAKYKQQVVESLGAKRTDGSAESGPASEAGFADNSKQSSSSIP